MKTKLILTFLSLFLTNFLNAQVKYLGGEISVKQTGTYSVIAKIELFTSINDDVQNVQLHWGDGTSDQVPLIFAEDVTGTNIKYNQYEFEHIYGQEDTYELTIEECCLGLNFENITQVDPVNFQLNTRYFHNVNDPLLGINQMPFFEKGIITGNALQLVNYTSNVSDLEGDDIRVEVCNLDYLTAYNQITEVYPINNNLELDSLTGDFFWAVPQIEGNYLLALCITESRNGIILSEYTRNMVLAIDAPLSSYEIFNDEKIKVFPNPALDQLEILMPNGDSNIEVSVFDTQGKKVIDTSIGNQLNVAGLSSGLYVLLILSENELFSKKIMVE